MGIKFSNLANRDREAVPNLGASGWVVVWTETTHRLDQKVSSMRETEDLWTGGRKVTDWPRGIDYTVTVQNGESANKKSLEGHRQ